jgi:hypothetical protein
MKMIEEKLTPAMRQKLTQMIHKDYRATFYERLDCLKDSEPLFEDLPYPQRYGKTLQYSLDRISVCIHSDEKIECNHRDLQRQHHDPGTDRIRNS